MCKIMHHMLNTSKHTYLPGISTGEKGAGFFPFKPTAIFWAENCFRDVESVEKHKRSRFEVAKMEKRESKNILTPYDNPTPKYDMWTKFSEDQKYLFDSFKEKIAAMTDITEPVKNWLCK
jgi:hypothetical protein